MGVMWLTILQRILFSLAVLLLCGLAFLGGTLVARSNRPDARPLELPSAATRQDNRVKELIEDALAARFAGNHREALKLFDAASAEDPAFEGLDYQRGLTFLFDGDIAAAEEAANVSLGKKEEEANAYALLVMCAAAHAASGETTDSEKVGRWAVNSRAKDPLGPFVHYAMGEYSRAVGQPLAAVDHYRRALERVSATDSYLVATVKAGLSGIRLGQDVDASDFISDSDQRNLPPEQLFFAAAHALRRGDNAEAEAFLARAQKVVQKETFDTLLKDSFFQDYFPEGRLHDPQPETSP